MKDSKKSVLLQYVLEAPNCISIFLFPFFLMMASPVLIEIAASLGTDVRNANLIFTFFNIGIISGQLTSVFYNIRFRRLSIINAAYALLAAAVVLLFFNNSTVLIFTLYLAAGYFIGVFFIQANEYLLYSSIENKDRLITIVHTFWPIGALAGPVASSYIVQKGLPWNWMYFAALFFILLGAVLYNTITRKREYGTQESSESGVSFKQVFVSREKNRIFVLTAISLLMYAMSETVVSSWMPTFFRMEKMFDAQSAGFAISLFWGAVIAGRIIGSILLGKASPNRLLIIFGFLGLASLFFIIFPSNQTVIMAAIAAAGMGFSSIYPLLVSKGSNVYGKNKGMLLTVLMAAAALGISTAPFLTRLVARYSMKVSVVLSIILLSGSIAFIILNRFLEKAYAKK